MTPEEWHKIKGVLQAALELDPPARSRFLDEACADQTVDRTEIESLIRSYDEAGTFLQDPVDELQANFVQNTAHNLWLGRRIGPYQITDQIGEGGMGTVFRATRVDGLYESIVAIKVIRLGLETGFFLERFRNERRILAGLEHSNIARLLDGGVTDEGHPYVVLENVVGLPIDQYCDEHKLSTDDRLKLFRAVCSAVQYAHQNLVVHRDLKPGNILVTEHGDPKLLDFGIAKILDPQQEDSGTDTTTTVLRMITPDFASPEQVRGDAITTASDVYSLGVILYILLTGRRPYRVKSSSPQEIIKAICETEPERPSIVALRSNRVKSAGTLGSSDDPEAPKPESDRSHRTLGKDLDYIVLKALRKEPARRYATAERFSDDIQRYLDHLPVSARKDTFGYRTSKFISRHKAGVAAAAAVVVILVLGLLVTLREARIAERRFNDTRQLANSLIFDIHDSIKDLPGSTPARKLIVERALQYLDSLARESREDLSLQRELATAYERVGLVQGHYLQNNLGDTKGSLHSYEKALSIRKQIAARSSDWSDRLALATAHRLVANQQWALGDYPIALENVTVALTTTEGLNSSYPSNPAILKELGLDYEGAGFFQAHGYAGGAGDPAKVEENYRRAVATDKVLLTIKPDDPAVLDAYATDLNHLGAALESSDPKGALEYFNNELQIEKKLQQGSPQTRYARGIATSYSHLGDEYDRLGDAQRSLENFAQGLEVSLELVREDPRNIMFQQSLAIAYTNTAGALSNTGRKGQSLDYVESSEKIMRALIASAPQNVQQQGTFAAIVATNGVTLLNLGKPESALKKLEEARSTFSSLRGNAPIDAGGPIMTCTEKMGEAASRAGDSKLAEEYFNQVLKPVEPALRTQQAKPDELYLMAASYSGLGDLQFEKARDSGKSLTERRASWTQAQTFYQKSLDASRLIQHPLHTGPLGLEYGDPAQVERKLRMCESALANLETVRRK